MNLLLSHPELSEEWDYEKNIFGPDTVTRGMQKKVWWKCSKNPCGCHEWQASISNRANLFSGCPFCTNQRLCDHNNLLALYPDLSQEWDYGKNNLTPNKYSYGSTKKVWWKCSKNPCGCHEWKASIKHRTRSSNPTGCPNCASKKICSHNNLLVLYPKICEEWDYEKII
jgi:hypothetical protein